jgi:cytidylate kinase
MLASTISALPEVREALLPVQRRFAGKGGVVCEGRDMGTVVFPDADLKIYLDADIAERARRRHLELVSRGVGSDFEIIRDEIARRDKQDMERGVAPLRVPEGAVIIDTTGLSIQQVTGAIMRRACNLRGNGKH